MAILLLGLCCFLSINPPVHGLPAEDAPEEEADAEDGGDDEGEDGANDEKKLIIVFMHAWAKPN